MSEENKQQPLQYHPKLSQLNAFAGIWKTEGEILATSNNPAVPISGTDIYEWLPGGYFLIHHVDVRMGENQVHSTEIIGYDSSTDTFPMHYFGHKGSTGVMVATLEDDTWKFKGETERFTGSFNESGDVMSGKWERLNESAWEDWMTIRLTKTR